jgi:hypothetical protein
VGFVTGGALAIFYVAARMRWWRSLTRAGAEESLHDLTKTSRLHEQRRAGLSV